MKYNFYNTIKLYSTSECLASRAPVISYKIYAAQIDALPSSNGRLHKNRPDDVNETSSVVRSNVSWIDLQIIKVNSLVP